MSYSNIKAFTLVELIVVITIVWILSTVGFVSYSWYLTGARDSNRFSQLTKLSDSLQTYAASKSLPLPDDYIEITASGATNVIAYQWYVWVDVLETIDYTNGGKDPKDDSYFTYYLTKDRKSLQLLALMEDGASANTDIFQKSYAVDYEERFPRTYGNRLWVLTDTTNTPVQEIGSLQTAWFLDIFHTADEYTAYFWDSWNITGTGNLLWISILSEWLLVAWWNFDTISWINAPDSSWKWNNGVLSGATMPNIIAWKKWNGLNFTSGDGTSGWIVDIPKDKSLDTGTFTLSFWINPDANPQLRPTMSHIIKNYTQDEGNNLRIFEFNWDSFDHQTLQSTQKCAINTDGTSLWIYAVRIDSVLWLNQWHNIVCTFNWEELSVYLNGELENSVQVSDFVNRGSWGMTIWAGWPGGWDVRNYFDGQLDEIYIFKKPLSSEEIKLLYDATK